MASSFSVWNKVIEVYCDTSWNLRCRILAYCLASGEAWRLLISLSFIGEMPK